jgi:hypothetical protein
MDMISWQGAFAAVLADSLAGSPVTGTARVGLQWCCCCSWPYVHIQTHVVNQSDVGTGLQAKALALRGLLELRCGSGIIVVARGVAPLPVACAAGAAVAAAAGMAWLPGWINGVHREGVHAWFVCMFVQMACSMHAGAC